MRLGKPTRLERQMHREIVQGHAERFMAERGYVTAEKPDGWPDRCGRCGAPWTEIGFDYADGFNCRRCGGSDADE